jgi:hypothetical protein
MPWKRVIAVAVILLLGAAFLAGYVPERRLRMAAEEQARLAQNRLAAAEARVRFGELLGEVRFRRALGYSVPPEPAPR